MNCENCARAHADTDGECGSTWYCGTECSKHRDFIDETYLDDAGVDLKMEKSCWEPCFWRCNVPEVDALMDGTNEGEGKCIEAWNALLASFYAEAIPL